MSCATAYRLDKVIDTLNQLSALIKANTPEERARVEQNDATLNAVVEGIVAAVRTLPEPQREGVTEALLFLIENMHRDTPAADSFAARLGAALTQH